MTLFRSGDNLLGQVKLFVQNSKEITVFSPFIRVNKLKEILGETKCTNIIVRWQTGDILFDVTDFEKLYEYCKTNDISLFRNVNIHLKVIQNERNEIIYGSSNITNKGMGEAQFNLELSGINDNLALQDLTYLRKIINESDLIDEAYFFNLKSKVEAKRNEIEIPDRIEEAVIEPRIKDHFLLSSLPMSETPALLFEIYSDKNNDNFSIEEMNCAIHDLANYSIANDLEENEFYSDLRLAFNTHPFIVKLKNEICYKGTMRYGGVVNWIRENTTTVPTPRNWELKKEQIVNILYDWICFFDSRYTWNRPNHSQVIYFTGS